MKLRNILTIFKKDALDAVRDSRVLVALLVPIGLAVFYNLTLDDEPPVPEVTVAHTVEARALAGLLRSEIPAAELTFMEMEIPEAVREAVASGEADVGLSAPPEFDRALTRGERPQVDLFMPGSPEPGAGLIASSIEGVLQQMAGQEPPAKVTMEEVGAGQDEQNILLRVGPGSYFVLAAAMATVVMICLFAVPIILTEETEKRTLEALTMAASYTEVIVAKALVGIAYTVVAIPLLLALVGMRPEDPLLFGSGILLLAVALAGFGLLIGGLFRNANQLNTWMGLLILPIAAPAFMVGLGLPEKVDMVLDAIPVSAAAKLTIDGLTGEAVFGDVWLSVLVIIVWAAAGYALLGWTLRRREA